ncbi:MAG: translation initiation factor IF-3 [Candidatus Gracilibacteria bacterium]|nr:translation initiation factor IF-3 [Candidatus Gracilibacteria bacterium]MDQ7022861.1 translation initiation factor IF-3 [Candidatus Gracilibacteria bacterium]
MKGKKRIINDNIKSRKVQLILEDGENLGEMSINDARIRAKELSLDLMEISCQNGVSVVKMLDFGKYLYRQKKQVQKQKAAGKVPDMKTLRITYKIGGHDLDVKRNQAEKFSKIGHPLKITLMLRGRENHYANIAQEKMETFIQKIEAFYKLEGKINKTGNTFSAILKILK